ncbi:precorrin-3B synthase [Actinoplanes bogorensis]|uniref:Precorrin-3B synthase n=2 Tax=Paractinoplanes bogorensis TaxID=1610840 RepID=A0ABS5YHU4_9ACTN|nr:precorrin-3B synthase [Actinoplanes bogorensis]
MHTAADGPLARVRLPGGMITGPQLAALHALAPAGFLELTSRANVQLRALIDADPVELAARLAEAGLLPSETHETVRNIAAPPLADATIRALVEQLDRDLCGDPALAALPGRFLFAIGAVPLSADVAAVPVAAPTGGKLAEPGDDEFAILFADEDHGIRVSADQVVPALLAAANAFLAERATAAEPTRATPAWRLHELPDGPATVAARTAAALWITHSGGLTSGRVPSLSPGWAGVRDGDSSDLERREARMPVDAAARNGEPTAPVGIVRQSDGLQAVGALVPLGRLGGPALTLLSTARRIVVTPGRGIVVPDLTPEAARRWARALDEAGLPTDPHSRWTGVTACAGKPGCAKSLADVRADADTTTTYGDGLPVHWIGCARGCGSPSGAHVRVEATGDGYRVSREPDGKTYTGDTARAVAAARRN